MSSLSTHVLDTSSGTPAAQISFSLHIHDGMKWWSLGEFRTDKDGRAPALLKKADSLKPGVYRLTFQTGLYFAKLSLKTKPKIKTKPFYPEVQIIFEISSPKEHYHVPLLISGFGYSTYRGS
jgi:5-hydroxyisourate hydrolase